MTVIVDGITQEDNTITLVDDKINHNVEVIIFLSLIK
jgi:hypothetical protein